MKLGSLKELNDLHRQFNARVTYTWTDEMMKVNPFYLRVNGLAPQNERLLMKNQHPLKNIDWVYQAFGLLLFSSVHQKTSKDIWNEHCNIQFIISCTQKTVVNTKSAIIPTKVNTSKTTVPQTFKSITQQKHETTTLSSLTIIRQMRISMPPSNQYFKEINFPKAVHLRPKQEANVCFL
jgi:hypothetical protein